MPDLSGIPATLARAARWTTLAGVPALVAHPRHALGESSGDVPWLLWIHGRTASKELDPGRYLRLLRAGIGAVAIDLPGHGERRAEWAEAPRASLRIVTEALDEIDPVVDAVRSLDGFSRDRIALGGMSAGGMATLARLCRPHPFTAAVVECATGSWREQPTFRGIDDGAIDRLDPIAHLDGWRDVPLLILHNRLDSWVPLAGQASFVEALRRRSPRPERITMHVYDETGAPFEHAGFGRMGSDAKDRVRDFLVRWLQPASSAPADGATRLPA